MNALLAVLALALAAGVAFVLPVEGPTALVFCAVLALGAGVFVNRAGGVERMWLLHVFVAGLLARIAVGTAINLLQLQDFFGGDAITYDELGVALSYSWQSNSYDPNLEIMLAPFLKRNWGMIYVVAGIYSVIGRNPLAIQYFSAVVGAATAPLIYLCARHIFTNARVARASALFVAFYPSLVLWSAQGLKDGLIVFLLAVSMLFTLKLNERLSMKYTAVLIAALFGLLTLRFYIFYMTVVAIAAGFVFGMRDQTTRGFLRQLVVIVAIGLGLTYLGVLRTAGVQLEHYADLERVQVSRADLANRANSSYGADVDVSTTAGAIGVIPVGMVYLLFAPFPWQLANLRQSITLPEMIVWWASFPLLVTGLWFTLKFRLRQALPILLFTTMLTLAYSIFQGNVGTAYRQRSQLLIFYFIFVSVGFVLVRERKEDRERARQEQALAERATAAARRAAQRALKADGLPEETPEAQTSTLSSPATPRAVSAEAP
ncbi:MAG TPA: glycosyltransferase family 39 protein [Pyrinomonadaceae bacterium]|nr:glycosyltransferase family 39 protein [Pyrinomonadaceae bacterium]